MANDGLEPTTTTPTGLEPTTVPTTTEPITETAENSLETQSPADLIKIIKGLRISEGNYRTKNVSTESRLAAFEAAEAERIAATLTREQQLELATTNADAKITALEAKITKASAISALSAKNVLSPEVAYAFLANQIEVIDGEIQGLDAIIEAFVTSNPAMVGKTAPTLPNTQSNNQVSTNHLDTSKMSPMEKLRHAYGGK